MARADSYAQIIEKIFLDRYAVGDNTVYFARTDIELAASELGVALPKNLGDVVYAFQIPQAAARGDSGYCAPQSGLGDCWTRGAPRYADDEVIALFEFSRGEDGAVVKLAESHYRVVPGDDVSEADLKRYASRLRS